MDEKNGVNGEAGLESRAPLLSICIASRNRSKYIGQTLDSILEQCGPGVEVVVVDGSSIDDTSAVVNSRTALWPQLKYYPQAVNSGVDGDFDKAVELALGDYCWLMSDDDLLAPGAVERMAAACRKGPLGVIIDAEVRTGDMADLLAPRRLTFDGERWYGPQDAGRLLAECGQYLTFIGALAVRRDFWLSRQRRPYYGTEFIHVGVLFQAPLPGRVLAIGEPLVRIRYGAANWTSRSFEVWMFKWPTLVWSFTWIEESARAAVCPRQPWREPLLLLRFRAKGWYSWKEFASILRPLAGPSWQAWLPGLVALLPGRLVNFAALAWAALCPGHWRWGLYDLRRSRYYALGRQTPSP